MNNALLRTVRSFSGRRIACRSFVTENLKKIEDWNKVGISGDAKDSKIRVWWDVQDCKIPKDCDAGNVMRNIRDALRWIQYNGPVEFWGYGDMTLLPSQTLSDLHNAGVRLRHIPYDNDLQHQVMIADLIAWTKDHPQPATHMVLAEDVNYYEDLARLHEALKALEVRGY